MTQFLPRGTFKKLMWVNNKTLTWSVRQCTSYRVTVGVHGSPGDVSMPEVRRSSQTQPLDNNNEKNIWYMPAFHDRFRFEAQSLALELSASAKKNLGEGLYAKFWEVSKGVPFYH